VVISMGVAVIIGVVGYSLMKMGKLPAYESASAAETIIVDIASFLSKYGFVPAFVGGIILAGILASTMSTADSQLLAASSSISEDLVQRTFKVKLSTKASMWLARGSVLIISLIAIVLASDPESSVFRVVSFAWAGFGATFGPLMLFSLFWKRITRNAAIAGMVSGGVTVFLWKFVVAKLGGVWAIYELLPAFIVSCLFIVVVSLLDRQPEESIRKDFELANTGDPNA